MSEPIIVMALVLVVGTSIALVWWRLANRVFPGVDEKLGYRSRSGTEHAGTGSGPVVVSFGDGPPSGSAGDRVRDHDDTRHDGTGATRPGDAGPDGAGRGDTGDGGGSGVSGQDGGGGD